MLNGLRSLLLQLQVARQQGRRNHQKTISLLSRAVALTQDAHLFAGLASSYRAVGRLDDARQTLQNRLNLEPKDYYLNQQMVNLLQETKASTSKMVPFIQAALGNRPGERLGLPLGMSRLARIQKTVEQTQKYQNDWDRWAEQILADHQRGQSSE